MRVDAVELGLIEARGGAPDIGDVEPAYRVLGLMISSSPWLQPSRSR